MPSGESIASSENHLFDKEVFYSDVDEYMHMNNTVYLDIIQNGLCKMMKNVPLNKLSALDISYDNGASEGDHLSIWGIKKPIETGIEVYLRGKIDEINCFDARAYFKI
jgi:acyl-ACP thioesterase